MYTYPSWCSLRRHTHVESQYRISYTYLCCSIDNDIPSLDYRYLALVYHRGTVVWVPAAKAFESRTAVMIGRLPPHLTDTPFKKCVYCDVDNGVPSLDYRYLAMLNHQGLVHWVPAAKFRSGCQIDMRRFPFDEQRLSATCRLSLLNC